MLITPHLERKAWFTFPGRTDIWLFVLAAIWLFVSTTRERRRKQGAITGHVF